jgi:hypothetical protein
MKADARIPILASAKKELSRLMKYMEKAQKPAVWGMRL